MSGFPGPSGAAQSQLGIALGSINYPAVGNGATNDASIITSAVNAAGNTLPLFWQTPSVGWRYSTQPGPIVRPVGAKWEGTGVDSCILQVFVGAGNVGVQTAPTFQTDGGSITDMTITGANQPATVLDLENLQFIELQRVKLVGGTTQTWNLNHIQQFTFDTVQVLTGTGAPQGVMIQGGMGPGVFIDFSVNSGTVAGIGVNLSAGKSMSFLGGNFEGSTAGTVGVSIGSVQAISFNEGIYFENWSTACIQAAASAVIENFSVQNASLQSGTTTGAYLDFSAATTLAGLVVKNNNFVGLASGAFGIKLPTTIISCDIGQNHIHSGAGTNQIQIGSTTYPYDTLTINANAPTYWSINAAPANNVSTTYGISPKVGDRAIRTDATGLGTAGTREYVCTTGGASPVWTATAA